MLAGSTEAVGDTQSLEFLSTANRRPLAAPRQVSHGYLEHVGIMEQAGIPLRQW